MRVVIASAAVVAATCLSGAANAAVAGFFLDQSNVTVLPDGTDYLMLTIWDGTSAIGKNFNGYTAVSGDVVFELQTLPALSRFAQTGNKFGLDEFAFNTTLNLTQFSASNFKGLPGNWAVGIGSQNADGFGKFELVPNVSHAGANSVVDPLFFAISGISGDTAANYEQKAPGNPVQGSFDFAAHVINFQVPGDSAGTSSAWFGGNTPAPVPLPAAAWLLLSGLGGLWTVRKHRAA
jgi:hypothetical protein